MKKHNQYLASIATSAFFKKRKKQGGWLLFEAGIAIILATLALTAAVKFNTRAAEGKSAAAQGEILQNIALAAGNLIGEFYDSYQAGLPITKNGVTLNCTATSCDASGEARSPTMANLRAMGVGLSAQGNNTANYKSTDGANYLTQISRIPANCETIPDPITGALNGSTCNIIGITCIDKPVQQINAATGTSDDLGLGAMMVKIGADAGLSSTENPAVITGYSGAWEAANPITGTPPGIICVRFGFGSAALRDFLRVHDTRDPDFRNNVTVGGNIIATNGSIGTGTGSTGCRLGEILASGEIISRSALCVKKIWLNGQTGEIGIADNAGTSRVIINDAGEITSRDAAGTVKAGITYNSTESQVQADRIQVNAGTAGLRANGETFGDTIVINTNAAVGGACPTNNALVWGSGLNSLKLLKCVANVWTATGTVVGNIGDACLTNGQIGETPAGVSVICVNNTWMTTVNRMGKWKVSASYLVGHNNNVPKPACDSGGIPKIKQTPKAINASYGYVNFDATDNGPGWTIRMVDGENNPAYSTSIAEVGCWYD